MIRLLFLPLLLAASAPQSAPPDQFVLLDVLYTHTLETKGFSFFPLPPDCPDNWKAPHNFADGTLHLRLEVLSKPSDKTVSYQLCLFQDQRSSSKHA